MFGLELIAKLVKILRSDASPNQIAAGFIFGMIIGRSLSLKACFFIECKRKK